PGHAVVDDGDGRPVLEDCAHRVVAVAHLSHDVDAVSRERARDRVEDGRMVVCDDARDPGIVRRATLLSVWSSRHASTIRTSAAGMVAVGVTPVDASVRM